MIGPENGPIFRGSLESARKHGLRHRVLSHADLAREYPFMRFRREDLALWEDEAGVVFAEDSALAFQDRARELGAELRFGVKAQLPAGKTVITAGAWLPEFAPKLPIRIERQVMHWFDVPQRTPLFIWEHGKVFYSIP